MPEDNIRGALKSFSWPSRRKIPAIDLEKLSRQASEKFTLDLLNRPTIMGGKSNKFDFTNRTNSGAKFGQVIGTALLKEAEKIKKDANRHAAKARKSSTDSSFDDEFPTVNTHTIDLRAPGKGLGDEGVCILADALEDALKKGNDVASLALEDLNLAGNSITTVSLARLAAIVELSKYDLKTINLGNNDIKVSGEKQAREWEKFLLAFSGCLKLRRLDLTGNTELGGRALEVLARIHIMEMSISPSHPGGDASVLSLVSEGADDEMETANIHDPRDAQSLSGARFIKRRQGLRSLPYITLHNTGLDDAGALWLSYALEDHYYPTQLIDGLNAIHLNSTVKTYQQDIRSRGIDWNDNETLSKDATALLEKAELVRYHALLDDKGNASIMSETPKERNGDGDTGERRSMDRRSITRTRRPSIRSIRTLDGGEHEVTELESARKRTMRHVILHNGIGSVELWRAAIKRFRAARMILYIIPATLGVVNDKAAPGIQAMHSRAVSSIRPPTPTSPLLDSLPPHLVNNNGLTSQANSNRFTALYAPVSSPELAITDVTNLPIPPLRLNHHPPRPKAAFDSRADRNMVDEVTDALNDLLSRPSPFPRLQTYQQVLLAADSPGPLLPTNVVDRIIDMVLEAEGHGDHQAGILSPEQLQRIRERALDRATLMAEREWLRKDESSQVLMLLDAMGCLAYQSH